MKNKIQCLWWEEFSSSVLVVRSLITFKWILFLIVMMSAIMDIRDVSTSYWGFWNRNMNEAWLLQAISDVKELGLQLLKDCVLIIFFKILFWAVLRMPVPDRMIEGWSNDAELKTTTIEWILNKIKWTGSVKLIDILEVNSLGNMEHNGLNLLKQNSAAKKLKDRL